MADGFYDATGRPREKHDFATDIPMADSRKCQQCGVDLPANSPAGLCPACLLQIGVDLPAPDVTPSSEASAHGTTPKPTIRLEPSSVVAGDTSGDRVGPYKLLQQIGEGGMGTVWMAEQQNPYRRVAIKLVKIGMDTKQVLARFHAEQQAMALMDHPNIARVFDAGATDNGRPYFVMELVRGIPITTYCDREKLTTNERLDLLVKVCLGVQHAHQKGVIHRDIKPSNILVTMVDGEAVPKIIDFGIAKAAQGKLVNETLFTAFEQFLGTPAYMSPEQAEMTALDVDIRSDIYSLGVLMYEVLTGQTPFDSRALLEAGIDEMRRTIREKEPAKPSTRLSKLMASELTTTARQRKVDVSKLIRFLRGDLDCIVMKCLEKDRKRRYDTVSGLALDIRRFLEHQPVLAKSPSNLYRFQKLVRRNRLPFAAATLIALSLLLGTHWEQTHRLLAHLYQLIKSPEAVIAEVNFADKQPEFFGAYSYDGTQAAQMSTPVEETGAGLGGGNALVARFDALGLASQEVGNRSVTNSGFGVTVTMSASADNWINTTNLGSYKLYVTAKTTGLASSESHGRVQWQFLTHTGCILSIDLFATFTTNYQVYSFVLADGSVDRYSGGSWNEFVSHFDEIGRIQCAFNADNWRGEYRPDEPAAFYISNVKFVRLTRSGAGMETISPLPAARGNLPSIQIQPLNQTVNEGGSASFSVQAVGSAPLSWQWKRGTNLLIGETNATLTIRNPTPAEAGTYSVLITNPFGAVMSSNASLTVLKVREVTIAEVNFQDKQPLKFAVYSYCQKPVLLSSNVAVVPDAGMDGPALVASINGSGFTNRMNQSFAGFGATVVVAANRQSGIDTTNLASYKLYVTARTAGLKSTSSQGRVQWMFIAPGGVVLTVDRFATFTTNYQVYSFVLADGFVDRATGGSWNDFIQHFDRIVSVLCAVNADNWLDEYRLDSDDAFYISNVKLVRLVPIADPQPAARNTSTSAMPKDAGRSIGL